MSNGVNILKLDAFPDCQVFEPGNSCLDVTINNLCNADCKRSVGTTGVHSTYVNNPRLNCFGYPGYTRQLTVLGITKRGNNTLNFTASDISDGYRDSVIFLESSSFRVGPLWMPSAEWGACSKTCDGVKRRPYVCYTAGAIPCADAADAIVAAVSGGALRNCAMAKAAGMCSNPQVAGGCPATCGKCTPGAVGVIVIEKTCNH